MDALSTRVYLIHPNDDAPTPPAVTKDPEAPNLVFNGDMEFASNVGTPDGWMAAWNGDGAATQRQDSCVVREGGGRHSLRIVTPSEGTGLRTWSFPIKADLRVGEAYSLSFWARGGEASQTLHVGYEPLFGNASAICPSGVMAECSYTPQPVQLSYNQWTQYELTGVARFQPDTTGYRGGASMVSFELVDTGTAWIDDVVLTLAH